MNDPKLKTLVKVLRVMAILAIVCDLVLLFLCPSIVLRHLGRVEEASWDLKLLALDWVGVAIAPDPYDRVLTGFLLLCGLCAGVVLWQGKIVLEHLLRGEIFSVSNARCTDRAAVCCFLVALGALGRMIYQLVYLHRATPYNAFFVPLGVMGGLVCLVMSALFRQAAALKEENDLTI